MKRGWGKIAVLLAMLVLLLGSQVQALETVVGETEILLVGDREHVRTQETNLSNLITDLMKDMTGADLAMTNGGGIRVSVPPGDVTLEDILDIHPFENLIVTVELTGADVIAALEHGVSRFPDQWGGFMQVSGVRYGFDPAQPAGERIVYVNYQGQPIDPDATFVVATNGFIASGGDDYTMMDEAELLEEFETLDQALIGLFRDHSPVLPRVEGRISIY